MKLGRRTLLASGAAALLAPRTLAGERPGWARSFSSRSVVMAPNAAIATSQPLATQAGIDVLRRGGNAVDAALAAAAVLSVVEPMMSGPGGDLFAILWDPRQKKLEGLASAGISPRALTRARVIAAGAKQKMPYHGALSVTVPGAVAGWAALHSRFGTSAWKNLFDHAIGYAREGFPVSPQIAWQWQCVDWIKPAAAVLGNFEELHRVYKRSGVPSAGTRFTNPDLARSLALIASQGPEAMTLGPIGRSISEVMSRAGVPLDTSELAGHTPRWMDTIGTTYRGYDIRQMPLPGQGLAVLQIMNFLEGYDLRSAGFGTPASAMLMVEAIRVAFEDRARFYADPDHANIDVETLISKAYAATQRQKMPSAARHIAQPFERGDTTLVTAADASGLMVSLISSLSGGFGSGIVAPGTGVILQNRASGFSLEAGHPNVVAPGKRPLHTIIPGFVLKERQPWLAFGVMGGSMQPQGQAQILSNLIDHDLDLQDAGDAPRLRVLSDGDAKPRIQVESDWPADTIARLRASGYAVSIGIEDPALSFGGYQAVMRDIETGLFTAATEMRQDGQASGF